MDISPIEMHRTSRMVEEEELGEKIDHMHFYEATERFGLQQLTELPNRIKPLDLPK